MQSVAQWGHEHPSFEANGKMWTRALDPETWSRRPKKVQA